MCVYRVVSFLLTVLVCVVYRCDLNIQRKHTRNVSCRNQRTQGMYM